MPRRRGRPATGQNYWAKAGKDWREAREPGYYATIGGEERLLTLGRSD
ncbi:MULTISPECIES: hypothetical protein [Ramlibacter]|uniref:Uncharacterized protein n=1 Tax=Ramlibacter pinisoli TaxID=2682844 RepID=A0A6N8IT19_9BURK|nr:MULTISPECIES: hypothetical protein [Ramlibacter]MBA2965012.1 hypothetical protein [Ramlibacter sp. CGMCC 1.13660]MVQ29977.1 hypothetical protein [Ramlibacter pinisoli]